MIDTSKMNIRIAAVMACILLLISQLSIFTPVEAFADSKGSAVTGASQYIAFTSDVHNIKASSSKPDNYSADRLSSWIDMVKDKYGISYMGFCGDLGDGRDGATQDDFWIHAETVVNVAKGKGIPMCFTTGNHEYVPGGFTSSLNQTARQYTVNSAPGNLPSGANYKIYCLGAASENSEYTSSQVSKLASFLNSAGNNKPIFVLTHYPLHYITVRSGWSNVTRQTTNASSVIETLNNAVMNGTEDDTSDDRTIVFIWGHNHTYAGSGESLYDKVCEPGTSISYESGSSKTAKFYYMAAGCMSDSEYSSGSNKVKGKGVVVQVRANGTLGFSYLNASGSDVTSGGSTITAEIPPHEHDLTKTEASPASCMAAGNSAYWTCSICGGFFSDAEGEHEIAKNSWVIAKLSHNLTKTDAVAATCTTGGNSAYWKCSMCQNYFSNSTGTTQITEGSWNTAALGHSLKKTDAKAATCTAAGNSAYWTCSRTGCGKHFSDSEGKHEIEAGSWVIPAAGHDPVKVEAKPATCEAEGNNEYWRCSRTGCGKYFSDSSGTHEITKNDWVIPKLSHDLEKTEATAATCTTGGNTAYWKCSQCEKYFSNSTGTTQIAEGSWNTAALGHKLTKHKAVAATCTKAGNSAYWSCSREGCGKYFSDSAGKDEIEAGSWVIPAGHKLTKTEAVPATYTSAGNSEYWTCTGCGKYFSDEAGEHEITKDSWVVPKLEHDLVKTEAVPVTCTSAGSREYWTCKDCGEFFSDAEGKNKIGKDSWIIPEEGHVNEEYKLARTAGTGQSGKLTMKCSKCGEIRGTVNVAPVIAKARVNSKSKATISWPAVSGAQRYLVYFADRSKSKIGYAGETTKLKFVKKGLKKGRTYKFRVVAQRMIGGNWTTISGGYVGYFASGNLTKNRKFTNPKSIRAASASVTIKAGNTSKIKATMKLVKKNKKLLKKGCAAKYRYLSSNTDIAKVSSKGVITAAAPGTCTVYVIGVNGVSRGIKVTVV